MAKSKASEEEIIKLGKKIIHELQLEESSNTLGRWMSHYIAGLIHNVENCESLVEKEIKQKECCDIILKLWGNREHLPNGAIPLSELKPLVDLLNIFIEKEHPIPLLRRFRDIPDEGSWIELAKAVKYNSKNIFNLCILSQVNSELLEKKQEWLREHISMLEEDEKELLERLEYFVNNEESMVIFSNEKEEEIRFDELPPQKRYEAIFNKIESQIEEQKNILFNLKKEVLSS